MRWVPMVVAIALATGCGDQNPGPCSIPCDDGCPGGTTCSVGFCAADGDTCEPAFAAVTAGGGFACALDQFGRAWCWG
ncbi:MAG: hypothetical protein H0V17_29615, partial [Deltaproteobacteria bacterium]|nr:hypothetical protein [Deltaproteobacteria bacterium]